LLFHDKGRRAKRPEKKHGNFPCRQKWGKAARRARIRRNHSLYWREGGKGHLVEPTNLVATSSKRHQVKVRTHGGPCND